VDPIVAKINANPAWRALIAKLANISTNAIHGWKCVPANRLPIVEHVTGIPAREIRPDLFSFIEQPHARKRKNGKPSR
jgi:hypothetical protein